MTSSPDSVAAIDQLINRVGQLHTSPTVAQKLLQLTKNPEFEIAQVAGCLEHDPALAARILRVVNSSRYGLARKVSSIRHAAAYLGQRSLRMFAITFALVETLTSRSESPLSAGYWPRALTMASAASLLCEQYAPDCRDDAYTSGLLADVGILILAQLETKRYEILFTTHEHGTPLLEAEQEEFQFTHPHLGARLLELWEVPDPVVNAVAHHHKSEDANQEPLTQVVQTADLLASAVIDPTPEKLFLSAFKLHQDFNLDRDGLAAFMDSLKDKIHEGEDMVGCGNNLMQKCDEYVTQLNETAQDVEPVK